MCNNIKSNRQLPFNCFTYLLFSM